MFHYLSQNACMAVTVLLHYFYLSVFMWMFIEGVFLFTKMNPTYKSLKPSVCMAIGWGKRLFYTLVFHSGRFKPLR